MIKDEFENLSEKVTEFGEEFGSKKKVKPEKKAKKKNNGTAALKKGVSVLGSLLLTMF
jgi:hypothetical protein